MARQPEPPESFLKVISAFPNARELARQMGLSYYTVTSWKRRNFIPPEYWPRLLEEADKCGLSHVTLNVLIALVGRRHQRNRARRSRQSQVRDNAALASRPDQT